MATLARDLERRKLAIQQASEADRAKLQKRADQQEAELSAVSERLNIVERKKVRRLLLPDSSANLRALGTLPATAGEGLERNLISSAWTQGLSSLSGEEDGYVREMDTYGLAEQPPRISDLSEGVEEEFSGDPLDVLRSLDEQLYLELDRERAERDVRLAIAVPALALSIYAALQWSSWWILACTLPLSFIVRYSFASTQERTRVLRLVQVRSLRTPSIQRAYDAGRTTARLVIKQRQERRRAEENRKQESATSPAPLQ
ncbi:hypothetical protein [Modestobacter italicus]|uniref:hypothetical protein n=1 Tax=Modestobacter italicus (strain DSM 44449 / CECT 9708 / BC 501) TaxID=2732864 RepID=UPI001C9753D8|nr:hypothetical protein [Modestobacter italicus]